MSPPRDVEPGYRPKRFGRRAFEAPLTAGLRRLPDGVREELETRRRALLEGTAPWGAAARQHTRRLVLGCALGVPALCVVFWHFEPRTYVFAALLGGAYGLLLAFVRPAPWACGLALWAAGCSILALDGQSVFASLAGFVWFFHLALLAIGTAVGVSERNGR